MSASAEQLERISQEVSTCTKCPLAKTRCKAVPGEGNPNSLIMFIGEAPGKNEDLTGRPFVGDAGKLLDALLNAIDLQREDVFIANTVKCRPPGNRDPLPLEMETCKNYLDRQIATINPRLIVTLGRISMARFFPGKLISQIHGQYKVEGGRIVLPMYHPAAALRDQNGRGPTMAKFKEDGLTIPELLEKASEIARTEIWGVDYAPPDALRVLKVAEEASPDLEINNQSSDSHQFLQPTLQPADVTRPGEVIPIERIERIAPLPARVSVAPKPPRRSKVSSHPVEVATGEVQVIDSSEMDDGITAETNEPVLSSNEASLALEPISQSQPASETVKRNSSTRRKRKETIGQVEQLTLF